MTVCPCALDHASIVRTAMIASACTIFMLQPYQNARRLSSYLLISAASSASCRNLSSRFEKSSNVTFPRA